MLENSLKEDDIIFKSKLLSLIGQRLLAYILALVSFIFPDIMEKGLIPAIKDINYFLVLVAVIILLLGEIVLRWIIYEYRRLRTNKDNRHKMIALPEGVNVKDIYPFIVKNYYIKYRYYWNKNKTALNVDRIEEAEVYPGTCKMSVLRYDLVDAFTNISYNDVQNKNKVSVVFKTDSRSDVHVIHEKWIKTKDGKPLYQVNFDEDLSQEKDNKLIYNVVTTIKDVILRQDVESEKQNQLLEYIVLEIKNVTICIDFPDDIFTIEKDFITVGKSNVLLEGLASAIKRTKNNKNYNNKNSVVIKINSPAPDVRYGFKWNWGGLIE